MSRLQFHLLPFVNVNENIHIGDVIIWPFYSDFNQIDDNKIYNQIEKYLKQYISYNLEKQLLKVSLVSYSDVNNFSPLSEVESDILNQAILAFFFSSIICNNDLHARTSNDFKLLNQNFVLGENAIAIESGSIVQKTDGGYDIEEILFLQPFNVAPNRPLKFDSELLLALGKLLKGKNSIKLRKRIFDALTWISYAYSNDENFSPYSRVVMMMTAFEILFDGFENKIDFMKKIGTLLLQAGNKEEKYYSTRSIWVTGGRQENRRHHVKEWWSYDFYDLRNKIVHGQNVSPPSLKNSKNISHFQLSIKVFEMCIKRMLDIEKLYKYSLIDKIDFKKFDEDILNE